MTASRVRSAWSETLRHRHPRRLSTVVAFLAALVVPLTATSAQAPGTLLELYERVQDNARSESVRNREREAEFRAARDQQQRLLAEMQQTIKEREARKEQLKASFDANEDRLAELTTELDRQIGNLGELFGVYRQTADDTQTLLFDSLISLEYPERRTQIATLAEGTEVPTIPEMRELWRLLMQEIVLSGQVATFQTDVVAPGGSAYEAEVTRVGLFNIVTGDKYLNYQSENDALVELPRQPAGHLRRTAGQLTSADAGDAVGFALDPSRGALLGLLVQSPSLLERIQQGKTVGYIIIATGILGLLLVLERLFRLSLINSKIKRQMKDLDRVTDDNPLGRIMATYYENEHLEDLDVISRKLEQVVITDVAEVRKGLPTIKVLAAVAPLMGLLGTVTGMIGTFQAITLFGTGDPKLMAGGISQALVTTVLGLCMAIPLLLSHSVLNSRATNLSKIIGEQAAGLMARKAEAVATARSA
ncbi:MAG: MotA/TolQ/ExbB proton channel family protein [Pseudomonadota bacterium]